MDNLDIVKGVNAMKAMAENLCSMIEFCENNHIDPLLPYIEEMQQNCTILVDIFENAFVDLVRGEDDGK